VLQFPKQQIFSSLLSICSETQRIPPLLTAAAAVGSDEGFDQWLLPLLKIQKTRLWPCGLD